MKSREIALCSLSQFFARPIPLFASAQSSPRLLNEFVAAAFRPAYWSITRTPKRLTYSLRLARLQKRRPSPPISGLAEDYDRDLTAALAKKPQNPTEIVECRERLARTLKDLLHRTFPLGQLQRICWKIGQL